MAVYLPLEDFKQRLGASRYLMLTDPDETGTANDSIAEAALEEASSFLDAHLTDYLPLSYPYAPVYERATRVVAEHFLRLGADKTTEDSRRAFDEIAKWLLAVAAGTVVPVGPIDPGSPGPVDPGDPETLSGERVWTRATGLRVF